MLLPLLFFGLMLPVSGATEGSLRNQQVLHRAVYACRDGDLVFRYGNGFWSPYFRDASTVHKRFSHTGVIVFRNGLPWVVHSDAHSMTGIGKVHLVRLDEFLSGASDYAFYRLDAPGNVRLRIAQAASSYIGRPFDTEFDARDASKLYCSELVMRAVNEACGRPVIRPTVIHGKSVVAIDDCYKDPRIREIRLSGRA
ncbi:MAG: hypothetical protein HGB20_04335 [Chlorobiaceae bacterium]|nr:hypothetical protein [Chlorobiaceae bacterium]